MFLELMGYAMCLLLGFVVGRVVFDLTLRRKVAKWEAECEKWEAISEKLRERT